MTSSRKASNIVFFQMAWWSCVLSAAHDLPWIGVLVSAVVVGLHLLVTKNKKSEIKMIANVTALGFLFDTILILSHWIHIKGQWGRGFSPLWLVSIWAAFATTLRVSFIWLYGRDSLTFLLGGIFGGLTYYGVQKFGVAEIHQPLKISLIYISFGWAVVFPFCLWTAQKP